MNTTEVNQNYSHYKRTHNRTKIKPLLDIEKDFTDNNGKTYNKIHLCTF